MADLTKKAEKQRRRIKKFVTPNSNAERQMSTDDYQLILAKYAKLYTLDRELASMLQSGDTDDEYAAEKLKGISKEIERLTSNDA